MHTLEEIRNFQCQYTAQPGFGFAYVDAFLHKRDKSSILLQCNNAADLKSVHVMQLQKPQICNGFWQATELACNSSAISGLHPFLLYPQLPHDGLLPRYSKQSWRNDGKERTNSLKGTLFLLCYLWQHDALCCQQDVRWHRLYMLCTAVASFCSCYHQIISTFCKRLGLGLPLQTAKGLTGVVRLAWQDQEVSVCMDCSISVFTGGTGQPPMTITEVTKVLKLYNAFHRAKQP